MSLRSSRLRGTAILFLRGRWPWHLRRWVLRKCLQGRVEKGAPNEERSWLVEPLRLPPAQEERMTTADQADWLAARLASQWRGSARVCALTLATCYFGERRRDIRGQGLARPSLVRRAPLLNFPGNQPLKISASEARTASMVLGPARPLRRAAAVPLQVCCWVS